MDAEASVEIRALMTRFRAGDREAAGALVDHFYPELRRLAGARMRGEAAGHSWTPTVLINELYLELVKIRALRAASEDADERQSFLSLAGFLMRRLLIHHSRPLYRKAHKVEIEVLDQGAARNPDSGLEAVAEIENLLMRLEQIDPRLRTVVQMRVFEGKTMDEIAKAIDCSERTVRSHWNFARHWIERELDSP